MRLHEVHYGVHRNKPRKRVGRGPGSGHGKTAGRGHKGHSSRSGFSMRPTFEGGQMPLARRMPKRGFRNAWRLQWAIVNVADLERCFDAGATIDPDSLRAAGLTKGKHDGVKILGDGELTKKLVVHAHRFSRSALEKISQAGGEAIKLE